MVLRCTDNNEISVPITTLCMTDRQYLEELDDKTAVAALDKLGAMIKRSKEGSVVYVNLTGTLITDAGLVHLKEMPNLQELNLDGTKVTDAGLVHLNGLTKLTYLYLDDTQITDAGAADLQKTLPNCYITK